MIPLGRQKRKRSDGKVPLLANESESNAIVPGNIFEHGKNLARP